ncbi:Uncharacterised protein [Acinetobacter baumannii]|nr:Uncharacterised protein [Acinetobacter baumannii]
MGLQVSGGSAGDLRQLGDAPRHQAVVFGFPGAQHAVHAFAQQIDVGVVGAQRQRDVGIAPVEVVQRRNHHLARQRMGHIDAHFAGRLQLMVAEQRVRLLQRAQQLHAALIVETAFAGHLHLAGGADQQAHAQPLFQRVADRGARQLQAFGRPGEAAQFDDAGKNAHGLNLIHVHSGLLVIFE